MSDFIPITIPADGAAYQFYAQVTAESARRGSSLPIAVNLITEEDFRRVADVSRFAAYHGSTITWSRLYLPELFPQFDWILSADADILFRGDVAELWKMREGQEAMWILPSRDCPLPGQAYNEKAIGWYRERGLRFEKPTEYFCAGLALLNLKAMREGGWSEQRDAFLHAQRDVLGNLPNADQGVLNYLLQNKKRLLPRAWGAFSGDENADIDWSQAGAVHFVEDAPWNRTKITHLESDLVVEWKRLANTLGGRYDWHNWRRLAYVALKYNPWLLRAHPRLWLHFRNTRGVK